MLISLDGHVACLAKTLVTYVSCADETRRLLLKPQGACHLADFPGIV
jgi:hypothetical protein